MASKRGGARPGAGAPKGTKHPQTLEKEAARQILRQMVLEKLGPLVDSQVANAMGIKYLVLREKKTGKFTRIGKEKAELLLGADPEAMELVEVWEKDPNVQAFADLLNRAIDKPIEQQEHSGSIALDIKWQGGE